MLPGRGQQPRGLGRPSPSSTPSFPTPELSCSKLFFSFFFPNSGKPRFKSDLLHRRSTPTCGTLNRPFPSLRPRRRSKRWLRPCRSPLPTTLRL
ncbi:unnamed protein product [Urochloa humidicola]